MLNDNVLYTKYDKTQGKNQKKLQKEPIKNLYIPEQERKLLKGEAMGNAQSPPADPRFASASRCVSLKYAHFCVYACFKTTVNSLINWISLVLV
jgi:hypothetical protein